MAYTYAQLGNIMIGAAGIEACESGHGTTDPAMIGRCALEYGDMNRDGTLN